MSRSGYVDGFDDNWRQIIYRGQVASAIKGRRGQAFLRELIEALDALPEKELIADQLVDNELICDDSRVCALGAVGLRRGIEMRGLDPEDHDALAQTFGIARRMVAEIEWENDEAFWAGQETPEHRWRRVRAWAQDNLKP
jgi:hypothetical protein